MLLERFGLCLDCPEAYLERFRPCLERSAACLDHSGACLERSEATGSERVWSFLDLT